MRYMITDEMWAVIEKCLAQAKIEKRGRPAEISDRDFLEALLYLARTGIPWRDLPREFGKWDAIDNRYRRWLKNGTLQRLFELLTAHPELVAIRRILMDATNVRTHWCAAGAPKKGSASEQGLGRSRGGFSAKIVLTAVDENTPVAVEVLPGQVHEATQVEKMLDASQARLPQIEEAVADKGFDGEPQRQAMASRNIRPVIPYRVNRRNRGRVNRKAYAERNKIERLIGKLKEFRRIATRYDKLKETFLGIIQLALAYICLKAKLIVNRA